MNPNLSISRYGEQAWLIDAGDTKPVQLAAAIRAALGSETDLGSHALEVVPGASSVLVVGARQYPQAPLTPPQTPPAPPQAPLTQRAQLAQPANFEAALIELIANLDLGAANPPVGNLVTLEVHYDGADLAALAAELNLSTAALIQRHAEPTYEVGFCGFAPGFAYLTGLDPLLQLPRKASPRPQVPTGSVAIADSYTAVYPQASPGGWHLLGRTSATLFDLDRTDPALLQPGTQVRFVPVRAGGAK